MYWIESTPRIQRANLDGSDIKELLGMCVGLALTINPSRGRMYWVDACDNQVKSNDMDGQNIEDIYNPEIEPAAMALYGTIFSIF